MAQNKEIYIADIGLVIFQKRKASRYIKIRIKNSKVFVSLPYYTPYIIAKEVVESRKDWIYETLSKTTSSQLVPGMTIYGGYILCFATHTTDTIRTKTIVSEKKLLVTYPVNLTYTNIHVQNAALKLCERHLKKQASKLLPTKLDELARLHNFRYTSIKVAKFTAKWGSCDNRQNIKLNFYLLQLPEKLINYVIIHELCHTVHLNHSTAFWEDVRRIIPNYQELKKDLRSFSTKV